MTIDAHRGWRVRRVLWFAALALVAGFARAQSLAAPNVVPVSPTLTTSGQPPAASLSALASLGYEAVVYLAPPTVADAVPDEAAIVARQGLVFVNIPIPFDRPDAAHFDTFAGVLRALAGRRVLVHCQVNLRASTMVFLYRSIVLKDDPQAAWDTVLQVWSPSGPWRALVLAQLRQHGIRFEPL